MDQEFIDQLKGMITETVKEVVAAELAEKPKPKPNPKTTTKKKAPAKKKTTPKKKVITRKKTVVKDDFTVDREQDKHVKTPVKAKANTWTDTGEERDGLDDLIEKTITPRTRKPVEIIEVVCSNCGRKEKVPSSMRISDYHRCGNCVGG